MTIRVLASALFAGAAVLAGGAAVAAEPTPLNPAALAYKLPDQIDWKGDPAEGVQSAVLVGDPSKPGLYVMLVKWLPHHMSRPHWHPNDRYVVVMSGVWWVGTGKTYDPDHTTPIPAGSFVTHFAKQIHYDGAKDEPAVLEIVGQGPATAVPARWRLKGKITRLNRSPFVGAIHLSVPSADRAPQSHPANAAFSHSRKSGCSSSTSL